MSAKIIMALKTDKEIMAEIANRVVRERKVKDMSQKALSDASGVALATLRKFEKSGVISLERLIKIARTLNRIEIFSLFFDFQKEYQLLDPKKYSKIKAKQEKASVKLGKTNAINEEW